MGKKMIVNVPFPPGDDASEVEFDRYNELLAALHDSVLAAGCVLEYVYDGYKKEVN